MYVASMKEELTASLMMTQFTNVGQTGTCLLNEINMFHLSRLLGVALYRKIFKILTHNKV
jgi:hypothetical protein